MRSFRKPLIPLNGAKVRRKSHLAKLFPCFLPRLPAFLGPHVVAWHFRASEPLVGYLFQRTREGGKLGTFRGVTSRCHVVTFLIWREEWLRPYIITLTCYDGPPFLSSQRSAPFVSPYYIILPLLSPTLFYSIMPPSLLCLQKWLTHNAVCVCGQSGRPLDGGRREGKRSGNGS